MAHMASKYQSAEKINNENIITTVGYLCEGF